MKCPFCGRELKISAHELHDLDLYCDKCEPFMVGNKELWQELIRTRKALDRAKWWLNEIVENHRYTPISTAEIALKEITQN